MTHKIITHKSKATAIVLCLLLGTLGAHRWYLGHPWLALMWPMLTFMSFMVGMPLAATALLVLDAFILACRGEHYYKRVRRAELAA